MSYTEDYTALKKIFAARSLQDILHFNNFEIINIPFSSNNIFSKLSEYQFETNFIRKSYLNLQFEQINLEEDVKIDENNNFNYIFFKQNSSERSKKIIILLHGLNEKRWDKYLPWAMALLEKTGKDVLLFPLSFHMNRAPDNWSNPRLMSKLSNVRKEENPSNVSSSYVNAAISERLSLNPIRFLWSGIKTINDLVSLVRIIKSNKHTSIAHDATVDFFGYSIGAFLTEILLMVNPESIFSESKLFILCGGSTFNKMNSVSRFIIDSAAYNELQLFYVENFEKIIMSNPSLKTFFNRYNNYEMVFKCMLNYNEMKSFREEKLLELKTRIAALVLKKDTVFPPENVIDSLTGVKHNIPIKVTVMDFPYEYDHVNPFPLIEKIQDYVNASFDKVFDIAAESLRD